VCRVLDTEKWLFSPFLKHPDWVWGLLASYSVGKEISNPPCAFILRKRTTLFPACRASWKETANAFCPCLELGVFVKFDGLSCQVPGTPLPTKQDYDIIRVLFNTAIFRVCSGWSPSAIVLNRHTTLLTINRHKNCIKVFHSPTDSPLSWTGSFCQVWRFTLPSSRNTAAN
jgi:hypothetical protein